MKEYKSDEVNVTVTAADKNDLPEDAELVVEPVELSEKTEKKVEEAALKEKRTVKRFMHMIFILNCMVRRSSRAHLYRFL